MPKIKNWERLNTRGSGITWKLTGEPAKTRTTMVNVKIKEGNAGWTVTREAGNTTETIGTRRTKEDARKLAVRWMKANNRGQPVR